MSEILKRLEIIKSSIALNDEEIIEFQIMKLNKLDINDDIKSVILKLENQDYRSVLIDIENYLKKDINLVLYVDNELVELRLELKSLESKLQNLGEQKIEYLNDIDEFNTLYNLHLGELIESILNLKKEILYKQTLKQEKLKEKYQEDQKIFEETSDIVNEIKETIREFETLLEDIVEENENYDEIFQTYKDLQDELDRLESELNQQDEELSKTNESIEDDETLKEYEEIKEQYEQFHQNYENIKDKNIDLKDISEKEKKELKILWKKACKLCHPDIVINKFKEKAHKIMQALNDAYSKRDISKVKEILSNLENGTTFEIQSDTINDKEVLKSKITEYKERIFGLESEIEDIKHDETYLIIQEIKDLNLYFEELKNDFEEEKDKLEKELLDANINNTLKQKGDIYEKIIGNQFEQKGELVLYNGFIRGYEDQGVDIISLNFNSRNIHLIQCKNWTRKPMLLNDIEMIYKKLSEYSFDIWNLSNEEIQSHTHYSNNSINLSKVINEIKNDFKTYTIRKTLYISSDKIIDLNIGQFLTLIQPNIFKYKDMKIVIYSV